MEASLGATVYGPGLTRKMETMHEEMKSADKTDSEASINRLAELQRLDAKLRDIAGRLQAMVEACQERPSAIDYIVLDPADPTMDIETMICDVYRIMKTYVYAKDSPLRIDIDMWEAFKEQEDEFKEFYRSALKALETYREVLWAYRVVKSDVGFRPQRGDLQRIQQDKQAHVEERDSCIEAVADFQGKFSAMLTALSYVDSC